MTHLDCFDLFSTFETIYAQYLSLVSESLRGLDRRSLDSFYEYCTKQSATYPNDKFIADLTDRVEQELAYK